MRRQPTLPCKYKRALFSWKDIVGGELATFGYLHWYANPNRCIKAAMRNIFQPIVGFARSRTQEEWKALLGSQIGRGRVFVRENGEVAAVLGFAFGIGMVLFFKLFVVVFCLAALSYLLLTIMARE